ncbi:MAG: sensor histidine kinase [Deltaproteobacteria bacterium]|nr:sensor histidine kinase [Deltaproteobacteria bacterium]
MPARILISKVVRVIQSEFQALGIQLAHKCAALTILADEEMFEQVLVNLLLNSLHASASGSQVCISLNQEGKWAVLKVEDQGAGIDPELLPEIFKPYVAGNPEGHGLGLSIVKRFVEAHDWTIEIDSQLGRGTVVIVSGIRILSDEEAKI